MNHTLLVLRCTIILCTTGGGGTKSNYVIKFKVHSDFKNVKVKKKF